MHIRLPFLTALILLCLFIGSCSNKCPGSTAISTGEFSGNWLYENKELGLHIQLPNAWYLYTYLGNRAYPVPINGAMPPDLVIKRSIQLKEMVKGREPVRLQPLFSIREQMVDLHQIQKSKGPSISFLLMASGYHNAEKDIEQLMNFMRPQQAAVELEKTTLAVGHEKLKGLSVVLNNNMEQQTTRLTGIRNYGCYNLAVMVSYNTEEQFEKIKGILASASISKN